MLTALICWFNAKSGEALGTFGLDIHHRYSDTVQQFLNDDGLPEEGTVDYYTALAHRDQLLKGRRLAGTTTATAPITFFGGNETYRISSLGFLHYSLVSVGTPALTFLVGLDTSSELFWIPCDCINCARSLNLPSGKILIHKTLYIDAPITFGCGMIQTGEFLDGAGLNGLFGLGIGSASVPSILASKGVTANSFSMCFSRDGLGRIEFGDQGSPDQQVTPFNLLQSPPYYNVTVTQISVEKSVTNVEFTAIFDTTTSFVYLSDPAYSIIVEGFDSRITEVRYIPPRRIIFDYCYSLGGDWHIAYCLAIIKSEDVNIIGQHFMTGHRLVFDREKMVLGWKEENCYNSISSNSPPISKGPPSSTPPPPSPSVFIPEANGTRTPISPPLPPSPPPPSPPPTKTLLGRGGAARLNSMSTGLVMVLLAIFALV
ncbi:hypothetical protein ACP275_14G195000 [Erythranthe tilingii]